MAQFLKYFILFVMAALVINIAVYLVANLPKQQIQSSDQNASITSIKNSGSSSIIQDIIAEFSKKSGHTNSNSEGSINIAVTSGSGGSTQGSQSQANTSTTQNPTAPADLCLARYNLTQHTIIFYYANESHSNVMLPIVDSLSSNYTFYKTQELWNEGFNSCFGLSSITPTFVCAGTKEKISGEMSQSALQTFASRC